MEPNKKTILLVDDDDVLIKMYKTKLEVSGYSVITASNGVEGMETAKATPVDLLILDIMMPQLTGIEMLEQLRSSQGQYQKVPVIMLTNLTEREQQEKAQKLDVREFLIKAELTPAALVSAVQKYI